MDRYILHLLYICVNTVVWYTEYTLLNLVQEVILAKILLSDMVQQDKSIQTELTKPLHLKKVIREIP